MREHFAFLRMNRKLLRLKVNAAEDLLLNGVHEPADRGVCQHLLGKVDRRSVISACSRLDDEAALKLLAGIVLFSSDIEYVLLLLEKVQRSASPGQATAAVAQGLERIDFDAVSSSQMRRVLSLVAEVFGEDERPELLLGLLESRSFREAFDKSIEGLPESLAALVVPLRAVQAVILHGKPNTYDPGDLCTGIELLLCGSEQSLQRRAANVRKRLINYGLQACQPPDHAYHPEFEVLLGSFPKQDRLHGDLGMAMVLHLLGADCEPAARRILKDLARDHPDFKLPQRWLERVQSPERIGRFSGDSDQPERRDAMGHHERRSGCWIETMQPAWIQIGSAEHVDTMTAAASILLNVCIPNVVPLLDSGTTAAGAPYFVTPSPGRLLESGLRSDRGIDLGEATRLCLEGSTLFGGLTAAGVAMHDGELMRFALDRGGTLWLIDVSGAFRETPAEAGERNLRAARAFCGRVLGNGTRFVPPGDLLAGIEAAGSCRELALFLARSSRLGSRTAGKRSRPDS